MGISKIVIVGPLPPTVGGITSYIGNVIYSPLNKKFEFIPFTTSRPTIGVVKESTDYSIINNIGFITLIKSIIITIYHLIKYPFVLIFNNPKIIHIHTTDYFQFWENYLHIIISKIFNKKIILHIHSTNFSMFYEQSGNLARYFIQNAFSLINVLILLSDNQKKFFTKILSSEKIHVLPNFVDKDLYKFTLDDNKMTSKHDHTIDIVFIGGEESKRKGIYDVIKSIPIVIDKIINAKFIFIGRCNTEKVLENINKEHLNDYVEFKGYVTEKEKRKTLLNSDIFILPSYAEGLPIAILEAMASGLAIISTNVGSIPETIKDDVNGFLITPGDYEELAQKIILLSTDIKKLKEIRLNNINLIEKEYDAKIIIHKLNDIYNNLIYSIEMR